MYTNLMKELCCPLCGDAFVMFDHARLASRVRRTVELELSADGSVRDCPGEVPTGLAAGKLGDSRFALLGWCDSCSRGIAWVFTRVGRTTIVEAVELATNSGRKPTPVQLDSEAERRFWEAHVAAGEPALEGLVTQHQVANYRIDFALPDQEFGIEIDGYEFHSSKASFESDRLRHRALERLGWRTVRYSGKEACENPEACVRDAAEAAAQFRTHRRAS
ncbi:DUF559 domain-containing protein [Pseudonocardia alni]|uniref:endonuclease domain-containing protein n=1 Tax=Pseudonocardia alni TaxID=33907 RepID=UPI0033278A64